MRHPRDEAPDPAEARSRYAELVATYERRSRLVKRFRIAAVRRLELQLGDHVLDLGCGTGASFPYLVSAVGSTGRVTGIDQSDEMAAVARARVTEAGWDNVDIIVSEAVTWSMIRNGPGKRSHARWGPVPLHRPPARTTGLSRPERRARLRSCRVCFPSAGYAVAGVVRRRRRRRAWAAQTNPSVTSGSRS